MKRSTFLTVLCILTFVGSTYGILSNVYGYFGAKASVAKLNEVKEKMGKYSTGETSEGEKMSKDLVSTFTKGITVESIRNTAIASVISSVCCLLGALLMWRLKKEGFYAYLLGTIIGIVAPLVIMGTDNFVGIIGSIFVAVVGIAFCVMYFLNSDQFTKTEMG